ncbi:MAG: AAA family ATPase [Bacteroidota bacterium]|nr:AAA family ATPase [Bacteroidota bacterium]
MTANAGASDQAAEFARHTSPYPAWARELARKYFTKTLNQFILHGNVRDLVYWAKSDTEVAYVDLIRFLTEEMFAARHIVVKIDRTAGIQFSTPEGQKDFNQAITGYDTLYGTDYGRSAPRSLSQMLRILDNYFRLCLQKGKRIACIIDFAETVIPMAESSMYSMEDRSTLVCLQRWAHDELFLQSDFTICLIAESLSNLNQQHVQSPWTAPIAIDHPGMEERLAFAKWYVRDRETTFKAFSDVTLENFAENTPGLGFTQLRTILADVVENNNRLNYEHLSELKKQLIEESAAGMLEFVESRHTLDDVAGHQEAKEHLRQVARALRNNSRDVIPMGYLISGPVGTGKTFLITCFSGEIGIPMVKLKNFRSQWQGQTEGNLERILRLLESMPPVAVMIDEADAALGNRDAQGDSGVSKRIFGQIATFMSDPSHRGRIIFFLITARPDLMPVDLKRQGRAEEHLALFYPTTRQDRLELLHVMMRRTGISLPDEDVPDELLSGAVTYSGADMEALLTRAKFKAAAADPPMDTVTAAVLREAVEDFIPPSYGDEQELQALVAVLESTSREALPELYRTMNRAEVSRRATELKIRIP